jgi:hypothetical protein
MQVYFWCKETRFYYKPVVKNFIYAIKNRLK